MYCPNCGKAEQEENSFCRNCGAYLIDSSGKLNIINRLLGVTTPEKQITVNLLINSFALVLTVLLLGFLKGFYDAGENKNPPVATPNIIYFVYAFLILISAWQLLGIIFAANLRSKFNKRKPKMNTEGNFSGESDKTISGKERKTLPTANLDNFVNMNVTEETTKNLKEKVKRSTQTEQ